MRILSRSLPLLLLAFLFLPSEARAEHVVITSGTISHGNPVTQVFPGYNFNFAGAGLSARGVDEKLGNSPSGMSCVACASGQTFGASFSITRFSGDYISASSASVNGVSYGPIWFNGSRFDLVIEPVSIPFGDASVITLNSAFTFSGLLVGTPQPFSNGPVFSMTMSGQGIATLTLSRSQFGTSTGYVVSNVTYNFQPSAVPEPATLLLLGTGLAGVAARAQRRRKTRAS